MLTSPAKKRELSRERKLAISKVVNEIGELSAVLEKKEEMLKKMVGDDEEALKVENSARAALGLPRRSFVVPAPLSEEEMEKKRAKGREKRLKRKLLRTVLSAEEEKKEKEEQDPLEKPSKEEEEEERPKKKRKRSPAPKERAESVRQRIERVFAQKPLPKDFFSKKIGESDLEFSKRVGLFS